MAIAGIGIDLASARRLARCMERARFLQRVFGPQELLLIARKGAATAAANFAAKEAFGKALGTGILREFSLPEVQALRDGTGKPYLEFSGRALALVQQRGLRALVSLTHEGDTAAAFVILETREEARP